MHPKSEIPAQLGNPPTVRARLFDDNWVELTSNSAALSQFWRRDETPRDSSVESELGVQLRLVAEILTPKRDPVLVDIGAGPGTFSLLPKALSGIKVYSFEASKALHQYLVDNIALNKLATSQVETFPYEIGNRDGTVSLSGGEENGCIRSCTLDAFFKEQKVPRIDLLLINAEETQPLILAGARRSIQEWHPVILIKGLSENWDQRRLKQDHLLRALKKLGYHRIAVVGEYYLAQAANNPLVYQRSNYLEAGARELSTAHYSYQTSPYNLDTEVQGALALSWHVEANRIQTIFCPVGCDPVTLYALLHTRSCPKVIYCQNTVPSKILDSLDSETAERITFHEYDLGRLDQLHIEIPPDSLIYIPPRSPIDTLTLFCLTHKIIPRYRPKYLVLDHVFAALNLDPARDAFLLSSAQSRVGPLLNYARLVKLGAYRWFHLTILGIPHELENFEPLLAASSRLYFDGYTPFLLLELKSHLGVLEPIPHEECELGPTTLKEEEFTDLSPSYLPTIQSLKHIFENNLRNTRVYDTDASSAKIASVFNGVPENRRQVLSSILLATRPDVERVGPKALQLIKACTGISWADSLGRELEAVLQSPRPVNMGRHEKTKSRFTFLTTAKAFRGHNGIIQRNAISSWTALTPRPQIILFGDEEGSAEVAKEFSLIHVPQTPVSVNGVPLVDGMISQARALSDDPCLCYINTDIILLKDFSVAMHVLTLSLRSAGKHLFFASARRSEINQTSLVDFHNPSAVTEFTKRLATELGHRDASAIDMFIFSRSVYTMMPELAVGRYYWDTWLITAARIKGIPVIDCTTSFRAIHQQHDYAHVGGTNAIRLTPEYKRNLEEKMKLPEGGSLHDSSTHELWPDGLRPYRGADVADDHGYLQVRLSLIKRSVNSGSIGSILDVLVDGLPEVETLENIQPELSSLWQLLTITCALIGFHSSPPFAAESLNRNSLNILMRSVANKPNLALDTMIAKLEETGSNLTGLHVILNALIGYIEPVGDGAAS